MKQYLELLKEIKEKGTYKPAAREGMPGTQSLFGYQFRHDLSLGLPLLTTKKMFWKGVVIELLWFLKGDTNIKYLVDNGVNIWNEDAYQYYLKKCKDNSLVPDLFDNFIQRIKNGEELVINLLNYRLGDCGFQYGKVWRAWEGEPICVNFEHLVDQRKIDQIKNLIEGLKESPESRRHIVTAWDPAHDKDSALTWCHAMFQFNCRPLTIQERFKKCFDGVKPNCNVVESYDDAKDKGAMLDEYGVPKYYLDCQLYQRSADVFLGVPFNIASYALLTEIIAKVVGMIPGEFIHTFGDVHIYDNHKEAVEEQLKRIPTPLPKLNINTEFWNKDAETYEITADQFLDSLKNENFLKCLLEEDIQLSNYNPQPPIKAELSTGLKK